MDVQRFTQPTAAKVTHPEKVLVKAGVAAEMLSIGRSTFFRRVREGLLPKPLKIGRASLWRVDELRSVGQSNRTTTA